MSYLLLFLMITPNLVWILINRGMWPSDSCPYGQFALELYYALGDDRASWWTRMFTTNPTRPPLVPWITQWFVPFGRLLGHMDGGLLLAPFLAQYLSLVLLYKSLNTTLRSRAQALVGCLVLASMPLFSGVGRQLAPQPLQLLIVAWFLYIATHARRWDSITVLLHLAAASATALMTMLSTPAFCVVLGLAALVEVLRSAKGAIAFKPFHALMSLFCSVLVVSGIAWYGINGAETLDYARYAYRTPWVAVVENNYVSKLAQWADFIHKGAFVLDAALVAAVVVILLALMSYLRGGQKEKRDQARVVGLVALQACVALGILAGAGQQLYRYALPFTVYVAVILAWSVFQLHSKWVTGAVASMFLAQWALVQGTDFRLTKMEPTHWVPTLETGRIREYDLLDAIADTTFGSKGLVIMELRAFGLDPGHVVYHAWKKPGYLKKVFAGDSPTWAPLDIILTAPGVDGDVSAAMSTILARPPSFVVMPSFEFRRRQLESSTETRNTSLLAERRSVELAVAIAESELFERVPLPECPELAIYRFRQVPEGGS